MCYGTGGQPCHNATSLSAYMGAHTPLANSKDKSTINSIHHTNNSNSALWHSVLCILLGPPALHHLSQPGPHLTTTIAISNYHCYTIPQPLGRTQQYHCPQGHWSDHILVMHHHYMERHTSHHTATTHKQQGGYTIHPKATLPSSWHTYPCHLQSCWHP